jgi:hypothetical protein
MKFTFALLAVASVNAQCECLATEEEGLPPVETFTDKGFPEGYGATCEVWDLEDPTCQEGEDNFGVDWCTESWCYVSAECESAYDTVFFADTEYAETLKFSVGACASEEASVALYASAAAVFAAVAVSI